MKLVIAEKPSVAISIAKVIGANTKKDGYYEGNGYKVSWCIGHLIKMANPENYDEKYKKWNIEDLPIIPTNYKYEVDKNTKKQFNILKNLMNNKEINTIINACDSGREGELIFRLVYNQVGCKKNIKRLWISSMEDIAIKNGFENLKNGSDYDNLFESARARAIADWLVGINISRLYSILYKQNYSVGRVQTPTLAMIVDRDNEILNFKKEKFYTLEIKTEDFTISTERIDSLEIAEQLRNLLPKTIKINEIIEKEKITKPKKLYDLTTLQREANKLYGYSAKQTLDYLQSLYEKKMVTYPRTDSKYLTEDMKETIKNLINKLDNNFSLDSNNYNSIFDNSKVSDHYAIIPTISSTEKDLLEIPESERKIYELIKAKLLMACSGNLIENTTKITYIYENYKFNANGKVVIEKGFTKYLKDLNKKEIAEPKLPKIKKDDIFNVLSVDIKENFTQPKKHFTEDSLLKTMEITGNEVLKKDTEVERKGLGTPATRAGIIENLIYKGYVERDKKNLIATHKGVVLVTIVSDSFKSVKTTANWELKLSDIANGKLDKDEFIKAITDEIVETIDKYR